MYQIQQLSAYDVNIRNTYISQLQYTCALNKAGDPLNNVVRKSCCTAKVAAHRYHHLCFACVTSPCLMLIYFLSQEPDTMYLFILSREAILVGVGPLVVFVCIMLIYGSCCHISHINKWICL